MNLDSAAIRNVAREVVAEITGRPLKDRQKLVTSGLVDSLSVLRLITLLEKKLDISIPPETLQPEDFDDLDLIVETLQRVAVPAK